MSEVSFPVRQVFAELSFSVCRDLAAVTDARDVTGSGNFL